MIDLIVNCVIGSVFAFIGWFGFCALVEWLVTRIWNKDVASTVSGLLLVAPIWVPLLVAVLAIAAWVISSLLPATVYVLIGVWIVFFTIINFMYAVRR
jgi:hypothetical protein